jgi:hypothetical protein
MSRGHSAGQRVINKFPTLIEVCIQVEHITKLSRNAFSVKSSIFHPVVRKHCQGIGGFDSFGSSRV